MKKLLGFILVGCLSLSLFSGCGTKSDAENSAASTSQVATEQSTTAAQSTTATESAKPVTLTQLTWRVADVGDAFTVFTNKYKEEHQNVTIDVVNIASDQYFNTLKIRLLGGDAPDIIATGPGEESLTMQAQNGYLLDITDDPMLKNVLPSALDGAKVDGRVYGIPYDIVSLVVLYNKKIFADNGIKVPANYDEMMQVCETLKSKNIAPVVYGIKDTYLTQFFPYQISPTAVYSKNPSWDKDLVAGKVKFNSPEWKRVLEVPFDMNKKGYFTKNALGVGDQQSVEMFARGEGAMTFNGSWAVGTARAANPNIDVGVFPFPANKSGEEQYMTMSLGQIMAISKTTKNVDECKKYLAAWTDKNYAQLWTDRAKAISTIAGVSNNFDPSMNDLTPYMEKLKSVQFANAGWPAGVTDVFIKKFQEIYSGKATIDQMLDEMDKAVAKAVAKK